MGSFTMPCHRLEDGESKTVVADVMVTLSATEGSLELRVL